MIRFRRRYLSFAMFLTNCHCDGLCLRALSSSPCLMKAIRFQDIFSESSSKDESQRNQFKSIYHPGDLLPESSKAREQSVCKETEEISDILQDKEQCSNLSFRKVFYFPLQDKLLFHQSLERTFQSRRTMFSKKDLLQSLQSVDEADYKAALSCDLKKASPASLLRTFRCVTSFTVFYNIAITGNAYKPLCEALLDNMNEFSDYQLLEFGKILSNWSKCHEAPTYRKLAEGLDNECSQRYIKYWCKSTHLMRFQLMVADVLFWVGHGHLNKYMQRSVPLLLHKTIAAQSKTLIQVLFYYSSVGSLLQDKKSLPQLHHIVRIMNICSLEEILIAASCICIPKGFTRKFVPITLKRTIFHKILTKETDWILLLASKVLQRLELRASDCAFLAAWQQKQVDRADTMSLDALVGILCLGNAIKVDCTDLMSKVMKRVSNHIACLENEMVFVFLNIFIPTEETQTYYLKLVDELSRRNFPPGKNRNSYPRINFKLLENNIICEEIYRKCFKDLQSISETSIQEHLAMLYLGCDVLVEVFHPAFNGPKLNSNLKQKLFEKAHSKEDRGELKSMYNRVVEDVQKFLVNFTEDVHCTHVLPHTSKDFVLCTDEDGSFHPVNCFEGSNEWDVKYIPESIVREGKRLTVIWFIPVDGRKYFNELESPYWGKQKALKKLGYNTIQVDVLSWIRPSEDGRQSNRLWLSSVLQSAIFSK